MPKKKTTSRRAPKASPSPATLADLRGQLNLTQAAAARLLGWTIGRYIRTEQGPGGKSPVLIDTLAATYELGRKSGKSDPEALIV